MAEDNFGDLKDLDHFNPESNNFSQEDFETLDAPSSGTAGYESQDTIPEQDEEVSTTNLFGGEEPAEEDRYAAGASEADAVQYSSDPLISWGDEDESLSQPSAAVPEPESQGSTALDDLGGLAMGSLASAGLQSAFSPPSPPPAASRDPYPTPPQDREEVSSTDPISVSEAPAETKAAGKFSTICPDMIHNSFSFQKSCLGSRHL